MDNNKRLTPEEIDAIAETKALKHADRHYPLDSNLSNTNEFGMRRVFCISNFKDGYMAAAQENKLLRSDFDRMVLQRDEALDERDSARIMVKSLQRERNDNEALLKEAKKLLLRAYYAGDPPKSLMNEIYSFTKKITTGSERREG